MRRAGGRVVRMLGEVGRHDGRTVHGSGSRGRSRSKWIQEENRLFIKIKEKIYLKHSHVNVYSIVTRVLRLQTSNKNLKHKKENSKTKKEIKKTKLQSFSWSTFHPCKTFTQHLSFS